MKKSFKKAGAAVLSMAMLLSMGAISMPVYAAPDTYGNDDATNAPGQVVVKITGLSTNPYHQGEGQMNDPKNNGDGPDSKAATAWANDTNLTGTYKEKYDYLDLGSSSNPASLQNIEKATVTMYRVAQLTNDKGWDWEQYIKNYTGDNPIPGFTSFAALLANKDGVSTADTDKSGITKDFEFKTSSDDLQNMASYLERVIDYYKRTSPDALNSVKVGDNTINSSNVADGVVIPVVAPTELDKNHDGVVSADEAAKTENIIGYYIIVTETDQSGVIVQPVLVSLHNGEKKVISVKGSTIQFEKTMTAIVSGTETVTTGEGENAVTTPVVKGSDRFDSTAGTNLKNGLVAQDDIVKYEIRSQLPKYDSGVLQKDITPFVITDTASNGIAINAPTLTGEGTEANSIIDPSKFKVYLAETAEGLNDAATRWELTGSTLPNVGDYQLKVGKDEDEHGFKLTITGYQMLEEDTRWNEADTTNAPTHIAGAKYTEDDYTRNPPAPDNKVDQVKYIENGNNTGLDAQTLNYATRLDPDKNKINAKSMENLYISVQFEATVNKNLNSGDINGNESNLAFDRSYTDYIDITQVDDGMIAAVGETDLVVGDGVTAADVTNAKKADIAKQVLRVQLFQGETRYNKNYTSADYASSIYTAMDTTKLNALVTALNDAGYTEATADLLKADDEDGKGEFYRILLLLAKDKENITRNGEYNTAHMTYGNKYATGGGDVTMNTNYSKVYSVNLKLSKFIETLELTAQPNIPTSVVGYATFWEQFKDTEVSIPYSYEDGGDTVADTFTTKLATLDTDLAAANAAVKTAVQGVIDDYTETYPTSTDDLSQTGATEAQIKQFGAASTNTTLTANQKKLFAHMFAAENAERGADGVYVNDNNSERPVEGAVFHLARIDGNTDDAKVVKDYGYAVSANDGRLIKLNVVQEDGANKEFASKADAEAYVTSNAATHTSDKSYVFEDGGKWYVGYVAVGTDGEGHTTYSGDETWDMLDIGVYEVREIQVPTGFKKWDKARFEIKADKDNGTNLVNNAWKGSYSADVLNLTAVNNATSSSGLASIAETQVGEAHFDYYDANDGKDSTTGTLSKKMYNEYLDQLPATGGMGTVLFTAGGIAVILMAGALFVVYMKKRNAEEEE